MQQNNSSPTADTDAGLDLQSPQTDYFVPYKIAELWAFSRSHLSSSLKWVPIVAAPPLAEAANECPRGPRQTCCSQDDAWREHSSTGTHLRWWTLAHHYFLYIPHSVPHCLLIYMCFSHSSSHPFSFSLFIFFLPISIIPVHQRPLLSWATFTVT